MKWNWFRNTGLTGSETGIEHISVQELASFLAGDPGLNLIDVRTAQEYHAGHVPGTKWLVEFQSIANEIDSERFPKAEPIYLICRIGRRSLIAAKELRELGFERPVNIKGGFLAWAAAGFPVER